mmetsp:Transcript_13422/g.32327  ORF Transcript_13422/g.32327 Transcript_13422/m.32327 type:complete len:239 (+) Transcript_13422:86-802(+)
MIVMKVSTPLLTLLFILFPTASGFLQKVKKFGKPLQLKMSLKPAAPALMDSGKALARSGELIIDLTSSLNLYGGGLSAAGAQIRNSGDCVAQAAASCRFKTAAELVCDELREGATCLLEATDKLKLAIDEAYTDDNPALATAMERMTDSLGKAGNDLEGAGACIMLRVGVTEVGVKLEECGRALEEISKQLLYLAPEQVESKESSQRMAYAAQQMVEAANELQRLKKPTPKGKGWLKQ